MKTKITDKDLNHYLKIKKLENFHVCLWLLKDISWCNVWVKFGMFIAVPTLLLQIRITWLTRKQPADLIHNIAVCLWLCANITWMSGEFIKGDWFDDNMKWLPNIFFYSGVGLLVLFHIYRLFRRGMGMIFKPAL